MPIKFIPHWKSYSAEDGIMSINWGEKLNKLKEYKEDLPIHMLSWREI